MPRGYVRRPGARPRNNFEQQLTANVVRAANEAGWYAYHTHDSTRSVAGFPDVTAVRGDVGTFYFELKLRDGGVVSPEQQWVIDQLNASARALGVLHDVAWIVYDDAIEYLYAFLWRTLDAYQLTDALARNELHAKVRHERLKAQRAADRKRARELAKTRAAR